MSKLTTKKLKFVKHYTDVNDQETYKNAQKSAEKAGYSDSYAKACSYKLLKDVGISEAVEEFEKKETERRLATRDKKAKMIWEEYLKAAEERDRYREVYKISESTKDLNKMKYWTTQAYKLFREHGELEGHYVQKTESTSKVELVEEYQKTIHEQIRALQGKN